MNESLMRFAAEVNAVSVTVADLLRASEEIHRLPVKERDWEGRMICLARLYKGDAPRKSMAVGKRLEAMAQIITSGALPAWLLPSNEQGAINIAEPVFIAAACEPLIFSESDAYFQQTTFVDAVLRYAEPDGHA